jgi:5-methylcytosine-specific restriction endonuclease McrA
LARRHVNEDVLYKIIDNVKYKYCLECGQYYPMNTEFFYKNKSNKKDGFNTYCIKCTFARAERWVKNNPEKYKLQMKRKVANKTDIQRQRSRDAAKKNRLEGYQKKWRQENKDKVRKYNFYRMMNKVHNISKTEWENCKRYFDYSCAYCGISEDEAKKRYGQKLHKEHVDHDGANDLSNCVPACRSCNSQKWKYEFEQWYNENNEKYTKERYLKIKKWLESDYKTYIEK